MNSVDTIKKGLEVCSSALETNACLNCPYYKDSDCADMVLVDALTLIQQMEAKDVERAKRIAELEQELATPVMIRKTEICAAIASSPVAREGQTMHGVAYAQRIRATSTLV